MSDVFVVPNLNVAYETFVSVYWNTTACTVLQVVTGNNTVTNNNNNVTMGLPTRIVFEINAKGNKPALSFYSRFHLEDQKMPELKDAVFKLDLKLKEAEIDCGKAGDEEDCKKLKALQEGLDGWKSALAIEKKGLDDKKGIVDWFTSIGEKNMNKAENAFGDALYLEDQAEEQSSSVIPPSLKDDAKSINSLGRGKLEAINRIQFDGGAGQLEMTMSKEKTETWQRNSCWKGCSFESELSVG